MPGAESSLWNFSLKFYSSAEIGEACLALQDQLGMDVNLVLYLLWQARRGRQLRAVDVKHVMDLSTGWRDNVVLPLRHVRRFLKNPPSGWSVKDAEPLRQRVKEDELNAERLQQFAMEAAFSAFGEQSGLVTAATSNLKTYAEVLGVDFPEPYLALFLNRLSSLF